MKKKIKEGMSYFQEENRLIQQNKAAVEELNFRFLKWFLFGSAVICFVSFFIIFISDGEANSRMAEAYGITALIFVVIYFINLFIPRNMVLSCFYAFFVALLAYSAYSAAILYPNYTGVISLGAFMLIPIFILDKSIRSFCIEVVLLGSYLVYVVPRKEWVLYQDEIVYNISFTILGMILGFYLRRVRLENLELLRQGAIRETTDILTGLYNRRKLFSDLEQYEKGENQTPIYGISILDIDYFKTYNDTYGHIAGDECLKAVGECFRTYGKEHKMEFYRYGGEEFVAIAHEENPTILFESFCGVVPAVEKLRIPRGDGVVTISQGALFPGQGKEESISPLVCVPREKDKEGPEKGIYFQQYLSKADSALYRAKNLGRNRTEFVKEAESTKAR